MTFESRTDARRRAQRLHRLLHVVNPNHRSPTLHRDQGGSETSREAPDWVCVWRLPVAPLSVLLAEPEPEAKPPRPCHDALFPERLTLPRLAAETDPLERLPRRWA